MNAADTDDLCYAVEKEEIGSWGYVEVGKDALPGWDGLRVVKLVEEVRGRSDVAGHLGLSQLRSGRDGQESAHLLT